MVQMERPILLKKKSRDKINICFLCHKTYIKGIHQKYRGEALLMNTTALCVCEEIGSYFTDIPLIKNVFILRVRPKEFGKQVKVL